MSLLKLPRCTCGSGVCVCEMEGYWAAHCMNCDLGTGYMGSEAADYLTEAEAENGWIALINKMTPKESEESVE